MADRDAAFVALQRFGYGARPGDLAAIGGDSRGAVLAEISPQAAVLSGPRLPDTATALSTIQQIRQARRAGKKASAAATAPGASAPPSMADADPMMAEPDADPVMTAAPGKGKGKKKKTGAAAAAEGQRNNPLAPELAARFVKAQAAQVGFAERWVAFWTNHFAVEADANAIVRWTAGAFEREAIRPHVFGRFADLLLAVTQHPTMLRYLNNATSIGPDSPAGQRRSKGLNENHARELMELHTIGVDAGYTQADVIAFAKVLTGWTYGQSAKQPKRYGRFFFNGRAHEPGPQTVLGTEFDQRGVGQGEAVLAALAGHPATAQHLATKLVRHFVSDTPPAEMVAAVAAVFTQASGDLAEVAKALVGHEQAWAAPVTKLRLPSEFIFAAARALEVTPRPAAMLKALATLGQPFFNPPSPEGFHDDAATWLAPDAMLDRLDVAELMAGTADPSADARAVADAVLGASMTAATGEAIARAEGPVQGLTILLMSPEFQRR
jgi:uncharacterized protein (DUF1800 family)